MPRKNMLTLLQGGDRLTIGRYDQVAEMVPSDAKLFPKLIIGLWSAEALAQMRAADAAEKVTRKHRELLQSRLDGRDSGAGVVLASGRLGSAARTEREGTASCNLVVAPLSRRSQ